jgi:hypothetical protein
VCVPLGDTCQTAVIITPTKQTIQGATYGYADDDRSNHGCGAADGLDRYYSVTLTEPMAIEARLTTTSPAAPALLVRKNSSCTSHVACAPSISSSFSRLATTVLNPGAYFIIVDGEATGVETNYTLDLEFFPPGDACASATPLPPNPISSTTAGLGNNLNFGCDDSAPDRVYAVSLTAPAAIAAQVNSSTTGYDPIVGIFPTGSFNTCRPAPLACSPHGGTSAFAVTGVQPAGAYFVVVDGFDGGSGNFTLTVNTIRGDACNLSVPLLVDNGSFSMTGLTTSLASFDAGCGLTGPGVVHNLTLTRPTVVSVKLNTPGAPSALFMRSASNCSSASAGVSVCAQSGAQPARLGGASAWDAGTYTIGAITEARGDAYELTVDFDSAIVGDSCSSNAELAPRLLAPGTGKSALAFGSTLLANDDSAEPCVQSGGGDLVFRVIPKNSGSMKATLTPVNGTLKGSMYLRQACMGPTNIVCAQTGPIGGTTELTATVQAGIEYFLWVDSAEPLSSGQFMLEVSVQ